MDLRKTLEQLGYPVYYSNVLLFLLRQKTYVNAKEIAVGSDVPLSRVYSILIELEKQSLVKSIPGKTTKYAIVDKKTFLQQVSKKKEHELKEKEEEVKSALNLLNAQIQIAEKMPEVSVRHFVSDKEYWEVYNAEVSNLGLDDTYRIINNMRWAHSFLPEELEGNPGLKEMAIQDEKKMEKGMIIHHMVNPKALVETTISDLKTKKKIIQSLALMLYYDEKRKKHHYITIAPEFRNILIVILKDSTFFEFYGEQHNRILSAIQIKNHKIAEDFAKWFDGYYPSKHDGVKDYAEFKKEILKYAKELAGIQSSEIEKALREVEPIYG